MRARSASGIRCALGAPRHMKNLYFAKYGKNILNDLSNSDVASGGGAYTSPLPSSRFQSACRCLNPTSHFTLCLVHKRKNKN